jgi:hypothetical protein
MKELSTGDLVRELKKLERRMQTIGEQFVLAKFDRGALLKDIMQSEERYGAGLVQSVAEEVGLSDKTLYEEHAFAKRYNYNRAQLEDEIVKLNSAGRKINYAHFRKQLNPAKNPDVVGGIENHKDMTCRNIESLADQLDQAKEIYAGDAEVEGAIQVGMESLVDMQEHAEFLVGDMQHPKPVKGLSKELPHYKAWIKTLPCAISGATRDVDPHHVVFQSKGENGMDIFCIPLCREMHDELHDLGTLKFEKKYGKNLRVLVLGYVQHYVETHK